MNCSSYALLWTVVCYVVLYYFATLARSLLLKIFFDLNGTSGKIKGKINLKIKIKIKNLKKNSSVSFHLYFV